VLEVTELTRAYGTQVAIERVSLRAADGELVTIVGPSGCGKSTLLRCVAGLLQPTGGRVVLNGTPVTGVPDRLAVVFQDYSRSLYPWLSVRDNVALPLRRTQRRRAVRHAAALDALDAVGLTDTADKYPWQLSGGMQQRVAIARALACDPVLLLMDEPFGSVDAQTREDLEDLVLRVRGERAITILLVTHDIDESVYTGDRVIVLTPAPGQVRADITVDLPRPRDQITTKELREFAHLRTEVSRLVRGQPVPAPSPPRDVPAGHGPGGYPESRPGLSGGSAGRTLPTCHLPVAQRAVQHPGADQQGHDAACQVGNPQQRRHEMHEPAARLRTHGHGYGQRDHAARERRAGVGDRPPGSGGLGGRLRGGGPDRVSGTRRIGSLRDGRLHPLEPGTDLKQPRQPAPFAERAEGEGCSARYLDLGSEPQDRIHAFDPDERHALGPEADGDRHLAHGPVQPDPNPGQELGDEQHPGDDQSRGEEDAREEKPQHEVEDAELDDPGRRRHGLQPARRLPAFRRHRKIMVFPRDGWQSRVPRGAPDPLRQRTGRVPAGYPARFLPAVPRPAASSAPKFRHAEIAAVDLSSAVDKGSPSCPDPP
jgi:NitT/TauT family transport system ATP-binding protein